MPPENNQAVFVVQLSDALPFLILLFGSEIPKARSWYHVAADTVCPPNALIPLKKRKKKKEVIHPFRPPEHQFYANTPFTCLPLANLDGPMVKERKKKNCPL